ncbi:MAG: hypothetical protein RJQ09_08095 [Cyclobacteriaceae bacterium]
MDILFENSLGFQKGAYLRITPPIKQSETTMFRIGNMRNLESEQAYQMTEREIQELIGALTRLIGDE